MVRLQKMNPWLLTLLLWISAVTLVRANELKAGDAIPDFSAPDQFGATYKFTPGIQFMLLGFDMEASKQANQKLATLGPGWLEQHHAIYILDIHPMPAFARFFALPKMRKYPQRIILGETAELLAPYPHKPDNITILFLTPAGKIQEIRYWNPAETDLRLSTNNATGS